MVRVEKLPSLAALIGLAGFSVDMVLQAFQTGMPLGLVLPPLAIELLLMIPLVVILRLPR